MINSYLYLKVIEIIELPSLPKFMAININVLLIIALMFIVGFVALWQFVPRLAPENVGPHANLHAEYSYFASAAQGDEFIVNVTINNDGKGTIQNVSIALTGNVLSTPMEKNIESVLAMTTREHTLKGFIRPDAPLGNQSILATVQVHGFDPVNKTLNVIINQAQTE